MQRALKIQWLGRMAYRRALALQDEWVARKISAPQDHPDVLLLLEHDPVYTIGRTPDRSSLLSAAALPYPVETIQRGGQATYHGPGQLVGYPILDLSRRGRDLHRYLRFLEEVLIVSLRQFGVVGSRRAGLTGVWVRERKIASLGVGVRKWVTLHGFALNVLGGNALDPFRAITPCGIAGVEMTAIESERGLPASVDQVASVVSSTFAEMHCNYLSGE